MNIKIRKHRFNDGGHQYMKLNHPKVTIYAVVVDGKRVDSFLAYRNAQAKVRKLRENSRRIDSGN